MSPDELLARLRPWRERHQRTAYVPQLGAGPSPSRFGGRPDMAEGDEWPTCAGCERPTLFVFQLDLETSPADLGTGRIQLFYCPTDDGSCETWAPFAGANEARWSQGPASSRALPGGTEMLTERSIVGWESVSEFPHPEEHEWLGLTYHYDFRANTVRMVCPELGFDESGLDIEACSAELIGLPADRDKLLGWPRFVQGMNYPGCPRCGEPLTYLFQIDSEVGTDLMFGDVGIGHIMRCEAHPDVLSFAWDCH